MKRILLTGMSGTGKSSVISELAARGYKRLTLTAMSGRNGRPTLRFPICRRRTSLSLSGSGERSQPRPPRDR